MKIKNPFTTKNWTAGQIVLAIWVVFATVVVLITGWQALNNVVYREGVNRGLNAGQAAGQNNAITRVIELSAGCNAVSLFAGEGEDRVEVELVDSTCSAAEIKAAREAAEAAAENAVEAEATQEVDAEAALEEELAE